MDHNENIEETQSTKKKTYYKVASFILFIYVGAAAANQIQHGVNGNVYAHACFYLIFCSLTAWLYYLGDKRGE